jgi:glycerol-3-phosphate dehydrogenase
VLDHRSSGLEGLLSVLGVRYTTARATAARAADRSQEMLGLAPTPCRTDTTPLEGGDIERFDDYERRVLAEHGARHPEGRLRRLIRCYGTEHTVLLHLMASDSRLEAPLSPSCDVTRAEIVHAVRREMAVHLTDALIRRTDAGSAGHPGAEAVRAAAEVMAVEVGWDTERTRDEMDAVERFYRI